MRILLAIHRAGSLRGAAAALGVNHATVARALEDAEHGLGTRLFDRARSGLTLTQPGEALIPHAEAMEARMLEMQRALTGLDREPRGRIRVSLPPTLGLTFLGPMLAAFSERHPAIDVDVVLTNAVSDLARGEADVSIRIAWSVEDDVVGRRLVTYVTAVFASPAYLDARPDLLETGGAGADWLGWGGGDTWVAASPLPQARVRHVLPEVLLQTEAAAAGLGLTLLPAFIADAHPGLVRVPGLAPRPNRSIWLLLHGDLRRTVRVRAFVDFVAGWVAARRATFET